MPKLSIIVPVYNVEKYLRECLNSIVNQSLKDIEIICINDGSTDSSLSILEEYGRLDSRINIINKVNTGYGNTMNIGLEHASGDYIGIIESDDFTLPDMFETLYNKAVQQNADVVKSNFYEYRSMDGIQSQYVENLKGCTYDSTFVPIDKQQVFFALCSIWSGIYNREFLINNKIRFNETPGASYQDTSFSFQVLSCAARVFLIKDAFVHYRVDNLTSSVNSPEKVFCIFAEYEAMEKFLNNNPDKRLRLNNTEKRLKYRAYKGFYHHLASAFQYTFLLKMSEELRRDNERGLIDKSVWESSDWEEMQLIINNPNQFFKKTAKDYYDERLNFYHTLNSQMYLYGLYAMTDRYKRVIIYGAGNIGSKVALNLLKHKDRTGNICFAVTDKAVNPESLLGLPVYDIGELTEDKEDSLVLIAVRDRLKFEIMNKLQSYGFTNIVFIDALLLKIISEES